MWLGIVPGSSVGPFHFLSLLAPEHPLRELVPVRRAPPEVVPALRAAGQAVLAVAAHGIVAFLQGGEETKKNYLFEKRSAKS